MPRPSMNHAFTWTTEVYDRDGNFADERKSKAHVTDPDDRSMTLCGREIPRHATTDSADGADYCKRCERAVDRLNAELWNRRLREIIEQEGTNRLDLVLDRLDHERSLLIAEMGRDDKALDRWDNAVNEYKDGRIVWAD